MGRKSKQELVLTQREFAALVERPLTTIRKWLQHPDWPFSRKGPWKQEQKPEILKWAADHLKPEPEEGEGTSLRREKLIEEIRKIRASADTAEVALAKERGELMLAVDVIQEWKNIGTVIRTSIQDLGSSAVSIALQCGLPPSMAPEFLRKINELSSDTLSHLSGFEKRADGSKGVLPKPVPEGAMDAEPVGGEGSKAA